MSNFEKYLEEVSQDINYQVGKRYNAVWNASEIPVEFLGHIKDLKSKENFKPNSTIGDALTDKPVLVFKWLAGDNAPSSHGRKGDIVVLGKKVAKKHIKQL